MELWGITDSGKVRKYNQDVFQMLFDEEKDTAVLVVCDGMGGANAGNIASELAADAFIDHMNKNLAEIGTHRSIATIVTDAVESANTAVFDKSLYDAELSGMGTTLTAAVSTPKGEVVANIGDSRMYHITTQKISQITTDHSVVQEMIERGEISRNDARVHPSKNLITRALGTNIYQPPDIFFLNLEVGEYILLCSDGLSNVVSDDEIFIELQREKPVREFCEVLVDMALERGAPDNVTAVIFKK